MNHLRAVAGEGSRHEAAAGWAARLSAPDLSEAEALAFDAWLAGNPANGAAFDRVMAVVDEVGQNAPFLRRRLEKGGVDRRRLWWSAGAAAAAAAAFAVAVLPGVFAPARQSFATGVGEHRTITLGDGSVVNLNGATKLSVAMDRTGRHVALEAGEAVFDVTHDPKRPFEVAAGDRLVRVVGTQFDVKRRGDTLAVTVARGAVEVRPTEGAAGRAYRLHPGQRLEHTAGAVRAEVTTADPAEVMGWRVRRLVYRDAPLAEVVADLNQQFPTTMRIEDPSLAKASISGVLILDDQQAVVRRLALLAPIEAVRSGPDLVLRREGASQR